MRYMEQLQLLKENEKQDFLLKKKKKDKIKEKTGRQRIQCLEIMFEKRTHTCEILLFGFKIIKNCLV